MEDTFYISEHTLQHYNLQTGLKLAIIPVSTMIDVLLPLNLLSRQEVLFSYFASVIGKLAVIALLRTVLNYFLEENYE